MENINQTVEQEEIINETVETTVETKTEQQETRCTESTENANTEQIDLFAMMGIEPPPAPTKDKKDKSKKKATTNACCSASPSAAGSAKNKNVGTESDKIPNDLPIFVVLTNDNYQQTFDAGISLEEIRQELELQYPYLTKQNTKWTWEVQSLVNGRVVYSKKAKDKDADTDNHVEKRVLAIPSVKSNKAG